MTLLRLLLLSVALLAAAPVAARPGVTITVTRSAGGTWLVDYAFAKKSRVWFFTRSNKDLDGKPWRPQSWTVETRGVRLDRAGRYDVLTSEVPLTRVRIRMRPYAHPLTADYTPVLAFSDGGLAFYTDHFVVAALPSLAAARALPADLNGTRIAQPDETLVFNDPGHRLLLRGKTSIGRAVFRLGDVDAYIYSGAARMIETPAIAGVIDQGLPPWVRAELDGFTPRILGLYAERLGAPVGGRPTALVAWQGAENPGWSLGGSVLDHMVVMQISGQRVLDREPRVLAQMRNFIAHESAHFWLGQTVNYEREREGWIMEGGSDLMAARGTRALIPDYDDRAFLQREVDECLKLETAGKPLAGAAERGDNRAYYACGALLALAAEGLERKRDSKADVFTFVRRLIDAHRGDRKVTGEAWLTAFGEAGGDAATVAEIRTFLDRGVADPRAFWVRLFAATGVPFTLDGERLTLS